MAKIEGKVQDQEEDRYRPGDAFGNRRAPTASEQTLETGGRGAGGGKYDPYATRPPAGGQPVLPGQTGYINQRRPVARPSANLEPKISASAAKTKFNQTGESSGGGPAYRPYAQNLINRLHATREAQRQRLFPTRHQRPPDRSGTTHERSAIAEMRESQQGGGGEDGEESRGPGVGGGRTGLPPRRLR